MKRYEDRVRDLARDLANRDGNVFQFLSEDNKNYYRREARYILAHEVQ